MTLLVAGRRGRRDLRRDHHRLHLVDIENALQGRVDPDRVDRFAGAYRSLDIVDDDDQVVVGVSPATLIDTYRLPRAWRRVMGPAGPQSADLALLEAAAAARLVSFTEVVVASADHAFVPVLRAARAAGCTTTVVTDPGRLPAWQLYTAATRHLTLSAC